MHMSPEHVPENTISSDQPYTAHIIVSVFPMFPLRPIRPPPAETASGSPSAHGKKLVRESDKKTKTETECDEGGGGQPSLTSLVPEPHVFHASCNELVR